MYYVGMSSCRTVSTRNHFYLYFAPSIPVVRASAGCVRSFFLAIWQFRPPLHSALQEYALRHDSNLMATAARLLRDAPHRLIDKNCCDGAPPERYWTSGRFWPVLQNDLCHVRCRYHATKFKQVDRDCVHALRYYLVP